ncbi:MAG: M66 family metalloprotease [Gemmatimonadota bacterium]|nr:M66 family metalloprotease [Gemmatimonadota bacterium]
MGDLSNLVRLSLYGNNLSGTIPAELGNLSSVVDFWLSENQLSGFLPAELGKLSAVEDFGVQNNRLSGRIPPEFGRMSSLVKLALHNNNLSGTLPPELGELGNLSDLRVYGNPDLEGLLPRSFMNLGLTYLDIGSTDVCPQLDDIFQEWLRHVPRAYGLICPTTLVERFALSELHAATSGDFWSDNSGWNSDAPVGDWYGVTVGDSLVVRLDLPDNGLEGPLPPEIANLRELETFDLSDNLLSAGFPDAVVTMDALDTIRLGGNEDMEGPFPFGMIDMEELRALQYAETGLCASPSGTFQEWIDGLDVADGSTCRRADSVRLSLPIVYLTQAIQRPKGDLPLLSNRAALLRVFLVGDKDNAFFEPEVFATFTRDGGEVHRAVMASEQDRIPTLADEGSLVRSYNALIPARHIVEGTELVVVADSAGIIPRAAGSRTRFPETGSASLDVIDVPPMELTVVPVLEAEDPDSGVFDWTDGIDEDSRQVSQLRNSFPFSEFSATDREAYVTSLDLTESSGQWNLVLELERVRRDEEATGYWYGAALSRNGYVRGVARLNGWVSMGKPEDAELAHEVGHNLDLRHAPCGGAGGVDPDFPYPTGMIGMWGYDSREGHVLSPRRTPDVMGYCYRGERTSWLSDYYFEKVIEAREEKEGGEKRMGGAGPGGRMLVLWGGVVDGEPRIEPVHRMYTSPMLPDEAGPYTLEGIAGGGGIEFSLSFTPGEDVYGNKYFLFAIPIEEDWQDTLDRITLTGPEGAVTVDSGDRRAITVVTDPATGRILRDWDRALPGALGDADGLEVVTTTGILEAVRLR